MNKLISYVSQFFVSILRMCLIGGIVTGGVLYFINDWLSRSYGEVNLVIIVSSFCFFPLFFALFAEIMFYERRKYKRKLEKRRSLYTNE